MYDEAVSPSLHGIGRARHILTRMREAGREDILTVQLKPGMFDCGSQLRTVGIFALRSTFPLTGQDWPKDMLGEEFADGAQGIDERLLLAERQISGLPRDVFEGAEIRTVTHKAGDAVLTQNGSDYLRLFALPNMWFHLSMAYSIARQAGLGLGKADFDGWHAYAPDFRFVT